MCIGLQQSKGVHCNSGSTAQHHSGVLADGVGTEHTHHCHGSQCRGGRSGKWECMYVWVNVCVGECVYVCHTCSYSVIQYIYTYIFDGVECILHL